MSALLLSATFSPPHDALQMSGRLEHFSSNNSSEKQSSLSKGSATYNWGGVGQFRR